MKCMYTSLRSTYGMGWVSGLIGQRTFRFWALASVLVVSMAALAGGIAYGTTTSCGNPQTLNGSAFEVDTDANLVVNTTGCIDWLTGGTGTGLRTGVVAKNDSPTALSQHWPLRPTDSVTPRSLARLAYWAEVY